VSEKSNNQSLFVRDDEMHIARPISMKVKGKQYTLHTQSTNETPCRLYSCHEVLLTEHCPYLHQILANVNDSFTGTVDNKISSDILDASFLHNV